MGEKSANVFYLGDIPRACVHFRQSGTEGKQSVKAFYVGSIPTAHIQFRQAFAAVESGVHFDNLGYIQIVEICESGEVFQIHEPTGEIYGRNLVLKVNPRNLAPLFIPRRVDGMRVRAVGVLYVLGRQVYRINRRQRPSVLRRTAVLEDHCSVFIEDCEDAQRKVSRRVGGVNPGVGVIRAFLIIYGTVAADQRGATVKHTVDVLSLRSARSHETLGNIDGFQVDATGEHHREILAFGGVP